MTYLLLMFLQRDIWKRQENKGLILVWKVKPIKKAIWAPGWAKFCTSASLACWKTVLILSHSYLMHGLLCSEAACHYATSPTHLLLCGYTFSGVLDWINNTFYDRMHKQINGQSSICPWCSNKKKKLKSSLLFQLLNEGRLYESDVFFS